MEIKAIKTYENGFMTQAFAFGGEGGEFDASIKYRSSIQNFLIDTGDDVILIDTDMPSEMPPQEVDENTPLSMGTRITDYLSALNEMGYDKDDVTKILITHKHADHTGELRQFPNAEVYLSKTEAEELNLEGDNIVLVEFDDGPYYNFEKSQKIVDDVYLIEAIGHTTGNSIAPNIGYVFQGGGLKAVMIPTENQYTTQVLYRLGFRWSSTSWDYVDQMLKAIAGFGYFE